MRGPVLILTILLFSCTNQSEKRPQKTETETVTPSETTVTSKSGQSQPQLAKRKIFIQQPEAVSVKASMSGVPASQSPVLHAGDTIKKGQLLAQFDNTNLFLKLRAEKKLLRREFVQAQSQIPPIDSTAFSTFILAMNPTALLPPFPKLTLSSLQLLDSLKLLDWYDEIAREEAAMQNYFVFSPVNGRIGSVNPFGGFHKGSVMMTVIPEGFTVSPAIPGRKGTKISLEDPTGKVVKAVIRGQSAKTTQLSGKLKPGTYYISDQ